jgi:hypothetical protein
VRRGMRSGRPCSREAPPAGRLAPAGRGSAPSGPNSVPTTTTRAPTPLHTPTRRQTSYWGPAARRRPNWSAFHPRAPPRRLRDPPETGRTIRRLAWLCTHNQYWLQASAP